MHLQLSAALAQMEEVTSHNISESTRLTYAQAPQTAGSAFYTVCSDSLGLPRYF